MKYNNDVNDLKNICYSVTSQIILYATLHIILHIYLMILSLHICWPREGEERKMERKKERKKESQANEHLCVFKTTTVMCKRT